MNIRVLSLAALKRGHCSQALEEPRPSGRRCLDIFFGILPDVEFTPEIIDP